MFLQASICSQGRGWTTSNALWDRSHSRVPLPPWERSGRLLPCPTRPGDPLLVTSCGDHLRPVQTCSFEDPLPGSDIWWWPLKLKYIRFPDKWYASYWNTFLSPLICKENVSVEFSWKMMYVKNVNLFLIVAIN